MDPKQISRLAAGLCIWHLGEVPAIGSWDRYLGLGTLASVPLAINNPNMQTSGTQARYLGLGTLVQVPGIQANESLSRYLGSVTPA